ncbi:MAG: lytic transglycosylase, partial [Hydrocarboniphaga effusa]|nr:lytic transglycosylase [Hydrocarboniphaga effusa]
MLRCGWILAGLAMAGGVSAAPAAASVHVNDRPSPDLSAFARPALLQPNIGFWTQVFSEYSEYQSVIHFMDQPSKIYTVLDYRDEAARLGPAAARRAQIKGEKAVKKELDGHLKRVQLLLHTPEKLTPVERKVYELFADNPDPDRYKNAVGRFRAQRGLKEATERALRVSGQYLPKMEGIFESEGLPALLTRLPLVESSFNVEAYS